MEAVYFEKNYYCLKHSVILKHGLSREHPFKKFRNGYIITIRKGYIMRCDLCLSELESEVYGALNLFKD